jgi:hypothetical protein
MRCAAERWLPYFRAAAGAMVGVFVFYTFGVTAALFRHHGAEGAGPIVGVLFPVYYHFLYALGGLALGCLLCARRGTARFGAACASLLTAVILVAIMEWILGPRMSAARLEGNRALFGKLHGISMLLNLIALLGAIAATFLPKVRGRSESDAPVSVHDG